MTCAPKRCVIKMLSSALTVSGLKVSIHSLTHLLTYLLIYLLRSHLRSTFSNIHVSFRAFPQCFLNAIPIRQDHQNIT